MLFNESLVSLLSFWPKLSKTLEYLPTSSAVKAGRIVDRDEGIVGPEELGGSIDWYGGGNVEGLNDDVDDPDGKDESLDDDVD